MSTNYPGALDSFVNPTATDTLDSATVPHAAQHDNINDAMAAVQVTLGVNPQGGSATVVARLTAIESSVSGKAANNQTFYIGTTSTAINRSSASQTLTGVSIDGNAATATNGITTATTSLPNVTSVNSTTIPVSANLLTDASTIAVAKGGTGATATTGTAGSSVLSISPALTGTPTVPTASVDTNTTQIASTAFVLGQASAVAPNMDGTAAIGTSTRYARADHVHGSDTSKASLGTSNTFTTGTQIIATGADGTVGFRIKRNSATQTANLLEVTQSDGTTILAKIDPAGAITTASGVTASGTITTSGNITTTGSGSITSATNVTAAGFTSTGINAVLLGSAGSTGGNLVFATTGGTQSLIAATGATGNQTLPATAGTLLNNASAIDVSKITTGTTLPSNVVTSSLTAVGTITSGTWNATAIDISKGGTGHTYGSPLVGKSFLTATVTKANNTDVIPEAVFRTGTASSTIKWFSVKADTTYAFDGFIQIGATATATGSAARLSLLYYSDKGTTTLTAQDVILRGTSNFTVSTYNSAMVATAANTNADTTYTSTSATNHYIAFRGGDFSSSKSVVSGDTIAVTYTATLT